MANILVIEDEKLLLEVISKKLALSGMNPISCSGGEEALDCLEKLSVMPDVIWLDYHLKGMDGLVFLEAIKKNKKWEKIPVVVVSNSASSDEVHHMLALGINKYILKAEYRLDQIVEAIKEFISSETNNEKSIGG
ncbi:MAG TPA: response regulator [Candidatus Methanoperedens sp.]|nr:response regulator [Candidatus Methanoperedens sp.]